MLTRMRIERLRTGDSLWRFGAECLVSQSVLSLLERRERGVDRNRADRIAAALHEPTEALFAERDGQWWALLEQEHQGLVVD